MSFVRRLWQLFEPVHAVVYFDRLALQELEDRGLKGFWAGYVVQRAAPLGPVGPEVVTAAYFGFHPRRAAAVLPEAWQTVTPAEALAARGGGAAAALARHLRDTPVDELADLLWRAASAGDCAGRVLAAANQALPCPEDPVVALWQATTTLREHRGDGHVAALVPTALRRARRCC